MNLNWDPEIDTPATIAIIGGGPVGVEAALYARFLGYFVMLFDAAKVGHRTLRWGDHLMAEPWAQVTSPLGLAALDAQGISDLPAANEVVSYRRYVEQYLLPVARTDLLYDFVNINSTVTSVSRTGCRRDLPIAAARRAEQEFRLLIDSTQRGEYSQLADIVLDCSGRENRVGLASGGGLAVGETTGEAKGISGKVDVLGKSRQLFAGKHTLMVGNDLAACANALDLAQLISESEAETRLTWILPKHVGKSSVELQTSDAELAKRAQSLCESCDKGVVSIPAWGIESLKHAEAGWQVRLQTEEDESLDLQADVLINCAPAAADWSFLHDLSVTSDLSQMPVTMEPHYYVLGSKASHDEFELEQAFAGIRRTFAMIGGRETLDLYSLIKSQQA